MYQYSISRKQAGVLFGAYKRNEISVTKEMISWMYDKAVDTSVLANQPLADIFATMKDAVQAFFNKDAEECTDLFTSAYNRYNAMFK